MDIETPRTERQIHQTLRPRGRPIMSCLECRRRKIRCDHSDPCAHCVRLQRRCTYQRSGLGDDTGVAGAGQRVQRDQGSPVSIGPSSCDDNALSNRGSGTTVAALPRTAANHPASAGTASTSTAGTKEPSGIPKSICLGSTSHPVQQHSIDEQEASAGSAGHNSDLLRRIQALEDYVASISQPKSNSRNHMQHTPDGSVTQEWQVVLNKMRDWGKNSRVGTAHEFAAIISCYSEIAGKESGNPAFQQLEVVQLVAQAADFLRQCKNTASWIKIRRPTRLPPPGLAITLPPRDTADAMANLYFATFESTHRILHIPSFWNDYRAFWDYPESISPDLRLKVLLVISIGSSLYDHGGDKDATLRNTELVHQWIYDAETWLAGPLEKSRLNISGLQIYCLTILARQIFSIGGDTIWVSMGSLIHMAMQLGLHRDPRHLPDMPCLQAELRRRLWATIVDLAVQAALDSRMPPRISLDEFDTGPPANISDDEMDEATIAIQPHSTNVFTLASVQVALLESLPLRLRIVQQLGTNSDLSYHSVLDLSAQLTEAIRACNSAIEQTHGATLFHRNMLDYLVRRFIIPLNYAFSNQARENPLYYYSLKLSADAAIALIKPEGPDPHFSRLLATGGGLFRDGIRCAITAITLELLTLVQEQRLDGTLSRTFQYRDLLKANVRDLIALAHERIRLGETNVKGHMFLSMILAQVGAIENGMPVEPQIARSARDSLEVCHGLLSSRAAGQRASTDPDPPVHVEEDQDLAYFGMDLDWDMLLPDITYS